MCLIKRGRQEGRKEGREGGEKVVVELKFKEGSRCT